MTAANLLNRLAALGAVLEPKGATLVLRVGREAVPGELIAELRQAKDGVLTLLKTAKAAKNEWAAADWLTLYGERAAILEFDGRHPRARAEEVVWHTVAAEWWATHGEHVHPSRCAGCGGPLSGAPEVLRLPHEERVHLDIDYRCVIAFGRRWRRQASEALARLGIPTPTDECAADSSDTLPFRRGSLS
jgi:hypothetical protein